VNVTCVEGAPDVVATDVLMAVDRTPNTDDLDWKAAGITPDAQGYIPVKDRLEAVTPGIWALGDCNGRGAFTHTAFNDYEIVAANLLDGVDREVSDRIPAYALYIGPAIGQGWPDRGASAGRGVCHSSRIATDDASWQGGGTG